MSQKNHSGFTLLEILIALAIFTIVSVIMVKAMHTVFSSQSATNQKAARLAELQMAMLIVSRDIEQTIDRPVSNAAGNPEGFIGTAHALTFTHGGRAVLQGNTQRSTLQRTRYSLDNRNLIRTTWPVLDVTGHTQSNNRTILRAVSELQFSYLDNKGQFQSSWPPASGATNEPLPKAVQLSLKIERWGKLNQLYIIPGPPIEKPH